MACSCCTLKVRIIVAAVGISAGIMAGLCFLFMYHNISTTVMAFISSVFATLTLYLHLSYKKNWMIDWPQAKFKAIFYINSVLFVFAVAGMIYCLVYAGVNHQNLTHQGLQGENLWMTAVWCFMTSKWTGMSAWSSRHYSMAITRPLAHSAPVPPVIKEKDIEAEYF